MIMIIIWAVLDIHKFAHLLDALAEIEQLKVEVDALSMLWKPILRQNPVAQHAVHSKYSLLRIFFILRASKLWIKKHIISKTLLYLVD